MGNAIPAIPVVDSIRAIDNNDSKPINRENLRVIQTPQTFKLDLIKNAFNQPYNPCFTDEATVAELAGIKINLVKGDQRNIKVTTPEDLIIASALLQPNKI